jgi:hypothetical protein
MKTEWIFAVKDWLWALPCLVAGGVALWFWARHAARRRLEKFIAARWLAEAAATVNWPGKHVKFALEIAGLCLLALTLARPLSGPRPDRAESKGIDLVIVLDVSKSMVVEDVQPNRLTAVKKELGEWVKQLPGDRVGLVVFAGDAFVQAPLTFDYLAYEYVLQRAGVKAVSLGGTNISKAIESAVGLLEKSESGARFMLIISDGGDLDGNALAAARKAQTEQGIKIFTIGVGTLVGGKVPAEDYNEPRKDGKPHAKRYVNNEYGYQVTSRLDDRMLRSLALAGGGRYHEFKPGQQTFQTLRGQSLVSMARKSRALNVNDYYEWFQAPLLAAILLFAGRRLVPAGRRLTGNGNTGVNITQPATFSLGRGKDRSQKIPLLAVLLWLTATPWLAAAPSAVGPAAEALLAQGKPGEAVELMRHAVLRDEQDLFLFYNYALTLYRAGQYDEAIEAFQSLKQGTPDRELQAKASFQMGNAQVKLAEKMGQRGVLRGEVILAYERAYAYYEESRADQDTKESRHNHSLALGRLEQTLQQSGQEWSKLADESRVANNLTDEERRLRMALQAFERITEINAKNKEAARQVAALQERLLKNLTAQADAAVRLADQQQAGQKKPEEILAKRQQAVNKLEDAQQIAPDNQELEKKKQEQKDKMADLITDTVEPQVVQALEKPRLDNKSIEQLEQAHAKLEQALTLSPENQRAKDLNAKTVKKLEQAYVEKGREDLEKIAKSEANGWKLTHAKEAQKQFEKALGLNAESKPARDGMAEAQKKIPDLLAKEAESQVKAAKKNNDQNSAMDLQKQVVLLEKADVNLTMASAMDQSREDLKKRGKEVRDMLGAARDQLDEKLRDELAKNPPPLPGNSGGEESQEDDKKQQSLVDLQYKPGKPVDHDNFWNRKVRDW